NRMNVNMQHHIVVALIIWSAAFVESKKIRGISMSYKRFYRERKSFLCIDGSKLIPFDRVNDDYCDCADGSDEPGTAACPNGRFYCVNLGFRPHYVQSSRVSDGICDCCDGSDEFNRPLQTEVVHLTFLCRILGQHERQELEERMKTLNEGWLLKRQLIEEGALVWQEKQVTSDHRHTPDTDLYKCDLLLQLSHSALSPCFSLSCFLAVESAGEELQKVEEAYNTVQSEIRELTEKLAIDYGPEREFMFLLSHCLQLAVYEYVYTLCPFSQVIQKNSVGSEVMLGKWGGWLDSPDSAYSQMRYEHGEPCWQAPERSAVVTLACGTQTELRSVREPSKCHYTMELHTPAACRPSTQARSVHSEL
uniref:Glucosidase 2 subunit beta n=1 Tax=Electrophorus electricus TaxID=8005 RepID=A0AAY5EU42_ELEEL